MWVFPPPELADPFILKTLLELEAGRVPSAALLVPITPWSDATRLAFRLSALPCPRRSVLADHLPAPERHVGLSRRPPLDSPARQMRAPAIDVFGSFASAVLVPQARS